MVYVCVCSCVLKEKNISCVRAFQENPNNLVYQVDVCVLMCVLMCVC
jgi:hypothetical protein